jgi:hypothetical protein
MADELRIGLLKLLRKARIEHDTGFLKECICSLLALMELEVEQWSEPVPRSEPKSAPGTATATAKEARMHGCAWWNWGYPGLGTPANSLHYSTLAGELSGRSLRWFRKPTSTASPPAR